MSVLFIDTDCELWHDKVDSIKANLIKMPYILNGEEFFDDGGLNADYMTFFNVLRENGTATTAALNKQDYLNYFEPYFKQGEDILYISFSHKMSATFDFLQQALDELMPKYPDAKFTRFDTLSISMGAGIQCYYGGKKFIETNGNVAETVAYLEELRNHAACCFIVDSLFHLKKGGRISSTTAVVGSVLGIKPVLKIDETGAIQSTDKVKGGRKVVQYMFDFVCNNIDDPNYDIWIMHADNIEPATQIQTLLNERFPNIKTHIQMIGPVIGAHCGPGTLGIIFHGKSR